MLPEGVRRNYEVSIWTLQDSFITVLKPTNLEFKGQIQDPEVNLKDDGTLTFSCSIPMYLWNDGEFSENPIWYSTKDGTIIADMRKLKIIFNKFQADEKVLEFIITKVTESHEKGQLICKIESESLAFHELGHKGIKVSLSLQDFLNDYNNWLDGTYADEEARLAAEPRNNIDYWNEKIFTNGCDWTYEVRMDWSAYAGEGRENNKVYENAYVSDWELDANQTTLVAAQYEEHQEKYRIVEISNSNLYNITQKIAEVFGVYCHYEYEYDSSYHIIGKKVIYYNNFIEESYGALDITYPYETDKISRTMDATDICTKLYVTNLQDTASETGLISIMNSKANKSKEDYILNFDYLYKIGAITQEQYDAVAEYEASMRQYNKTIEALSEQILQLEQELSIQEATVAQKKESIALDREQMAEARRAIENITEADGLISITAAHPYRGVLIADNNTYKINLPTNVSVQWNTVRIYKNAACTNEYNGSKSYYENIDASSGKILSVGIRGLSVSNNEYVYYITYDYDPRLPQQNIYKLFAQRLANDMNELDAASHRVNDINTQLTALRIQMDNQLEAQALERTKFSALMGPALREGNWQPDSYNDYGEKHEEVASIIWDSVPFLGEQLGYIQIGLNSNNQYSYYYVNMDSNLITAINNNQAWDTLECVYTLNGTTSGTSIINSTMQYAYKSNGAPILLLTNVNTQTTRLISGLTVRAPVTSIDSFGNNISSYVNLETFNTVLTFNSNLTTALAYPRIIIPSLSLKIGEDVLRLQQKVSSNVENVEYRDLTMYQDYSILVRENSYYLTLKPKQLLQYTTEFRINYQISNADTEIYLDAREVSQTNAYPRVSYDVAVSLLQNNLWSTLYSKLGYIVHINDDELKFENVQGYISEINMKLDKPWEDSIKIKNYKTRFEDLFSQIVASSNIVQANAAIYDRTVSLFNADGTIKQTVIQTTLNKMDLDYSFRNGTLTIDDVKGIWGASDDGVVAFTGGGIFTATEKDGEGNWQWNTGIVPSGINASLINAGQLDTNLIRIFAGDNLRFQMNGQGLYAFRANDNGTVNLNQYVVYDEDGLRLHAEANEIITTVEENNTTVNYTTTTAVDRVKISWDGISITNNSGTPTFYVDKEGNAVFKGIITATALQTPLNELHVPEMRIIENNGHTFKVSADETNTPNTLTFTVQPVLFTARESNPITVTYGNPAISTGINYNIDGDSLTFSVNSSIISSGEVIILTITCNDNLSPSQAHTMNFSITVVRDGATGDPGQDATSPYTANIISINGDRFKSTTDWTVLYCNLYHGDQQVAGYNLDYIYKSSQISQIPTGIQYANKYYGIFTEPQGIFQPIDIQIHQYTANGEPNNNVISNPFSNTNYNFTWASYNQSGAATVQSITSDANNSAAAIYVGPNAVETKNTIICSVNTVS